MSLNTILATTPLTSTNYVLKATGTTIGNSLIWDNGTNVGIGNTNTSYTLDVSGTGRFSSSVTATQGLFSGKISVNSPSGLYANGITVGGTGTGFMLYATDSGNKSSIAFINSSNYNYGIMGVVSGSGAIGGDVFGLGYASAANTTYTSVLNWTSGGNVGIGFASPSTKLEVQDGANVAFSGSGYRLAIFSSTSAANADRPGITLGYDSTGGGIIAPATQAGTTNFLGFWTYNSGWSEKMRITSGGDVFIGFSGSAPGQRLRVQGVDATSSNYAIVAADSSTASIFLIRNDGYGYLKASAWAYGSDRRIKENINYIQTGLDKVLALKPATFDYIDGVKNNIGWIAQDVQEVIPEAVGTISETNDQLTLKSDFIVPYLVKAIQELSAKNEELSNRLIKLESK